MRRTLNQRIEASVHDGDFRGAVRLLTTECALALNNDNTLNALKSKHPVPSRSLIIL